MRFFRRSLGECLGDVAILALLIMQGADGALTYVGVTVFGLDIEANPLISELMVMMGHASGLVASKGVASVLAMLLHLWKIHIAVAFLAGLYFLMAIVPWIAILSQ